MNVSLSYSAILIPILCSFFFFLFKGGKGYIGGQFYVLLFVVTTCSMLQLDTTQVAILSLICLCQISESRLKTIYM
jgi:hypothetical protein